MCDLSFLDDPDFGLPHYFDKKPDMDVPEMDTWTMPPHENCGDFIKEVKQGPNAKIADFSKGTTTLSFVFQHGIIVAADARATMGPFIASNEVKKVFEINDRLLGTIAGGAADCMFWFRQLDRIVKIHEHRHKESLSASSCSKLLSDMLAQYRGQGLSVGTMISGFDGDTPALYFVDNDGTRLKGQVYSVGSGSPYAYGVMDTEYKWDLSLEDAIALGRRAIYHAGHRDAMSGGEINLYHVHANGWTKIINKENINNVHFEEEDRKGMTGYKDSELNYESVYP